MARNLFLIRTALILGVFGFAAFSYFRGAEMVGNVDAAALEMLRYVFWGAAALAAVVAVLIRGRVESAATAQQKTSLLIVGWAFGEGAALFGIVLYMIGGAVSSLALGLLLFTFTLTILPIPRIER
ncbi:MAG: hypothetical protein KF689_12075 [Gemmatimonadaceae bacterium]|nr:hypothetical protein [Gemmatimonadaceae bacterium]MCW5827283.1 hypothetical protein [Gemmatimonadaceae bacterium]